MTIEIGDVAEVTLTYVYQGEEMKNIFHFLNTVAVTTATHVITGFLADVVPVFLELSDVKLEVTQVSCVNIFDPLEKDSIGLALLGTSGSVGQPLPNFVTWSFRLEHDFPAVRAGAKRFGSLGENVTDDGHTANVTWLPKLLDMGAQLIAPFLDGSALATLIPIVVGRLDDGFGNYRLPTTPAELLARGFGFVLNALFRDITSQNSRKGTLNLA